MVRQGQVGQLLASLPRARRGPVEAAIGSGFAAGLNDLLMVTGALALVGALCALLLIRSKDFVGRNDPQAAAPAGGQVNPERMSGARSAPVALFSLSCSVVRRCRVRL